MEHKDISYQNQKIVDIPMEKRVKTAFIEYAMSVIVARALPDVRDGLKPVHRRILYAMYEDKLTYDRPFCKSATTVGNVLGRYHPHGDAAVYDSMVRLAQPFNMRYPLIEGHGNFGNVDGDGAAAYRYTEARMSKIANAMLTDIEKNVVPFSPNFDNRLREPDVLPARFPNLLVNGSVGIAVGMATNIPPHNLGEVIDGTLYLIKNPEASIADLMTFIKGPDFPTNGIICGTSGIYNAYRTGRGRVIVRARAAVEEEKHRIVITEIPYQVNKSMLVESMANLVKDKKIEGITAIRDESGKAGMKIVVEYRRDANGAVILNQLYKYTQLQDTCAVNMIALVNGEPKLLGLKEILKHYIKHQENVIRHRTEFDLEKTKARVHILEGLKIAIDNIDEVIKTIRASASVTEARDALVSRFTLTQIQAQAIVDMTLGKLSGLERIKVEEEYASKIELIKELEEILANEDRLLEIVSDELREIKEKFSDGRRTEISGAIDDIIDEDLIEKEECVVTITRDGYIKRSSASVYSSQRRGGRGIRGMKIKEDDFVDDIIIVNSHSYLLMFTDNGKVYMKKVYQIPEASNISKGTNLVNLIELDKNEKVTSVIAVNGFDENEYFVMVTHNGVVKRANVKDFEFQRKGGKIAINLDEGDKLEFVEHTTGENDIVIATREGKAVRFSEKEARVMGRAARGVRGIKLKEGDYVVGAAIVDEEKMMLTVTEKGYGKRNSFDGYTAHSRGTSGVLCHKLTEKTGKLAGIAAVSEDDDIMVITNEGIIIRMPVSDVNIYDGNSTVGVRVMRLEGEAVIVNFAATKSEEKEEEELQAAIEENENAEAEDFSQPDGDSDI